MNELNVKEFYKKQFELLSYDIKNENWLQEVAEKKYKNKLDIHFKRC